MDHAAAPIQYRAITEVAQLPAQDAFALATLPLTYLPAITLAAEQGIDGTWNRSMLTVPSARSGHFEGVGTVTAVRRLLECGWDREAPPFIRARRVLFRLLAEDDDPGFLFELAGKQPDEDLAHRGRTVLREAAAAALAQAGYEGDPRLRGAARRMLDRVAAYLESPLAEKPFVRMGNQHVLPPEASPPSIHLLHMLAHMPLFRTEHHETMEMVYAHLTQPLPRQEPLQRFGRHVLAQPHLILGDMLPHRNAAEDDVVSAVMWLELMARLGFLKRNDGWCRLFERFLDERDDAGVWHPRRGTAVPRSSNPFVWPMYPLEAHQTGEEKWTDLTFRLGLIARLAGRRIEVV